MNDTSTTRPASTISVDTSAMRRMFSTRSASVKPRSRFRPWRTLSPSSRYVRTPRACSFDSTMLAIVDLPDPDRPVNHTTAGPWSFWPARAALSTFTSCQWMLCERRSAKCSRPGTDGDVGQLVDDDEATGVAVDVVGVERDRPIEADVAHADLVQLERRSPRDGRACSRRPGTSGGRSSRRPCGCRSSSGTAGRAASRPRASTRRAPRTGRPPRPACRRRRSGRRGWRRSRRRAST